MNKPLAGIVVFAGLLAGLFVVVLSPSGPAPIEPPEDLATGQFVQEGYEPSSPTEADPAFATLRVPSFTMTNRDGQEVDASVLDGRYSVVAFIFTNCPFVCPTIFSFLHATEDAIERSDADFVLFSVDPVNDTPEALRAYGDERGLGRERWVLLTGPFEQTQRIVERGLKLTLDPDDTQSIRLADGSEMTNILHPSRIALIGPDRRVIAFYDSSSMSDAHRLAQRLDAIHDLRDGRAGGGE